MAGIFRGYALKNQDRLIRLEEQLRLADLLPEDQLGLIDALTIDQFIGLRFASDAEVAALAQRAVTENLTRKQIKRSHHQLAPRQPPHLARTIDVAREQLAGVDSIVAPNGLTGLAAGFSPR